MKTLSTPSKTQRICFKTILCALLFLLVNSFTIQAANYYWVGGTGNWNNLNHWATTSGGTIFHTTLPSNFNNDSVYFDSNSFTTTGATVTIDPISIPGMNWTGVTNNPNLISSADPIYGDIILSPNMNCSFGAFSYAGGNIFSAGQSFWDIHNYSGTINLLDDFSCHYLYLDEGGLNTNNFNLNVDALDASSTPVGFPLLSLNFGTSTITCNYFNALSTGKQITFGGNPTVISQNQFYTQGGDYKDIVAKTVWAGANLPPVIINIETLTADEVDCGICYIETVNTSKLTGTTFIGTLNMTYKSTVLNSPYIYGGNQIGKAIINCGGAQSTFQGFNIFDSLYMNNSTGIIIGNGDTLIINNVFNKSNAISSYFNLRSNNVSLPAFIRSPQTLCFDSMRIENIHAFGGTPFYAGVNSIDLGGNSGWSFTNCAGGFSNYYWVGGTGNWNDVSHWATTSGGTAFYSTPPDSTDDVYFDSNSFLTANETVFATADERCHNFDWSGSTGSPLFNQPLFRLRIYGSMILNPNMDIQTLSIYFVSNNPGNIINTNGYNFHPTVSQNFYLIFDNPNGEWILNSDLNTTYNGSFYSTVRLKQGTLNTNGYTVRCFDFDIYPNPVCTLLLDSSSIYCDNSFYSVVPASSLNLNAGTSKIYAGIVNLNAGFSAANNTFNYVESSTMYGSDCSFNHVVSGGYLYDNSNIGLQEIKKPLTAPPTWIQNMFCTAAPSHIQKMIINSNPLTWVSGNKVIVDTLILNNAGDTLSIQGNDSIVVTSQFIANSTAGSPIYIKSNNPGVASNFDFGANNVCVDYLNIKENNALGTGNHYAGANSVNSGLNSGWTFGACVAPPGYYWVGGTGNWSDVSHWATSSGGTTFHFGPPGPNDDVYFDANSFPSLNDTVKVDVATAYCKNFDWTGATNNPTISTGSLKVYGSFLLCPLMTCNLAGVSFLSSQSNNFIRNYGHLNGGVLFNNPTGEWELTDGLSLSSNVFNIVNGTFKSNDFNISGSDFTIGSLSSNPNCLFGNSTLDCSTFTLRGCSQCDFDSTTINVLGGVCNISSIVRLSFNVVNGSALLNADSCSFNKVTCTSFDCTNNFVKEITSHSLYGLNYFQKAILSNGGFINGSSYFDTLFIDQSSNSFQLSSNINDTIFIHDQFIINKPSGQLNFSSNGAVLSVDSGLVCLKNVALQNINAIGGAQFFAGQGCTDAGGNTGWTFAPCSVTSDVWPGDANYDLAVNNFDVLNIGLAYVDTGAVRAGASNNFVAQPAVDWNGFFQTAVNKKHADCNGDGIVDNNDTVAIALNYGQNHPARLSNPNTQFTPAPSLYIEINPDSAGLSDTVNVDVFLGTNITPVDSIYGIAFTLNFDTAYVDTTYMPFDYTGNWMGTPGVDLLTFQKTRFLDGAVDMAMVRTDHQNIAGFGFLERIGIVVVDNIGARISTPFTLSNVRAITAAEYELTINSNGDSLSLDTTSSVGVYEIENLQNMISVYPNPAKENFVIHSGQLKMSGVEIYNSMGEMVVNEKINSNVFTVNVTNLPQGVYLIRCVTNKGIINKRIVIAAK